MSTDLALNGGGSPFDAIRQVRLDGSEFWSARDLMPLLGYDRWENFSRCVDEAQKAAAIAAATDQFRDTAKMIETGKGARRQISDVEMTRYGAYMVAMSCDGRKPEVAHAKTYFAVRTHEAETSAALPQSREERLALAVLDAQQMITERDEQLAAVQGEKKVLESVIERDAPLVAKAEAHTVSDSAIHRQEFAREVKTWGRKQDIEILQEHVMRFLGHIGLFIRGERSDTGHATSEAIRRGLAFTDKGTSKKNGHAYAVGKLTPAGQDYAWKRITKYVADHGGLELPRELRGGDSA